MRTNQSRTSIDWVAVRARLAALSDANLLDDNQRHALMQQRAALLARPAARDDEEEGLKLLQFQLAAQRCAIETRYVIEVQKPVELTKLPGGPAHLLGLMNLRGEILPVFDLGQLLHTGQADSNAEVRLLVLGRAAPELCLFVDGVTDIVRLNQTQLLQPPASTASEATVYVRGVTHDAWVVIDALALLDSRELYLGDVDQSGSAEART